MESKEILLKPKDMYTRQLKEQYHKGATEYFEKLTKEAKTDTELNKKHVEEYNTLLEEVKKCENAVNNTKAFKIFLIVIIVICFVVGGILGLIGAFSIATLWYLLLIGVVLVGLAIYLIVHINTKIKKEQQKREQILNETREKAQKKLDECYADMAELNSLYDWNIPATIMENVTNIIDLDPYFSVQKYNYLNEKFGLGEVSEPNCSVLGVISGNIQGNPFVLEKTLTENLVNKTYHGSLTIHWTTYSRDSKGRSVAHHHSETLHASVTKPAPDYRTQTVLIYGNEAAPHLHFRRGISKINSYKNEKEKEKAVKEGMKEINKYAEKTIKEGGSFTPIGNDEFDVFFGGLDRDNEVEFRLLFTPLAQQNMLSLLNDPEPYGDDFNMVKNGMINIIASAHSQSFDYSANPNQFQSYDYQQSQASFVNYCDQFIQNLYFDLAPLLSIPLYQMHKPHEYIYEKEWNSNYSSFEQEALANGMSKNDFIPRGANSSLPLLLKTTSSSKVGKTDKVNIHAYSYHTTEMCDYVRVHGGDGHNHDVPVHWIKYDRVDSDTEIGIRYVGSTRKDVQKKYKDGKITSILSNTGNMYYERGLLSFLNPNGITQETDNQIASLFEEIRKEIESNN